MATVTATMQNLGIDWQVQDAPAIITDLTKRSVLIQTAEVAMANAGFEHKYKRFNALPSGTFGHFGTGIVPSSFSKDMEKIPLWDVSLLMEIDTREADKYPGGKDAWFKANYPAALAGMGNTIAKQIFYGTELQTGSTYYASQEGFLGLAQYNLINGTFKEIDTDDTHTGAQSSLHVVRWERDTGCSLRIYPQANGQLINVTEYKPQVVTTDTTTGARLPVYSWLVNAYMALIVPSADSSFMVCGFNATDSFVNADISNAIDVVQGGGAGRIAIYTNLQGIRHLRTLKYNKVVIDNSQNNIDNRVFSWDGVPVYLDTNLVATEYAALYE